MFGSEGEGDESQPPSPLHTRLSATLAMPKKNETCINLSFSVWNIWQNSDSYLSVEDTEHTQNQHNFFFFKIHFHNLKGIHNKVEFECPAKFSNFNLHGTHILPYMVSILKTLFQDILLVSFHTNPWTQKKYFLKHLTIVKCKTPSNHVYHFLKLWTMEPEEEKNSLMSETLYNKLVLFKQMNFIICIYETKMEIIT